MKWIFKYLKGTSKHGILFARQHGDNSVVGYVDVDNASNVDDSKLTTSYIFTLLGLPIYWRYTLQSVIDMSTTEVKYMVVAEVAKEAPWLKRIVKELGSNQCRVQLHCDNHSVIYLAKHLVYLAVRFHKIRELIVTKEIFLKNVHTLENVGVMLQIY